MAERRVQKSLAALLTGLMLFSDAPMAQQSLSPIERASEVLRLERDRAISLRDAADRAEAAAKAAVEAAKAARQAAQAARSALKDFEASSNNAPRSSSGKQSLAFPKSRQPSQAPARKRPAAIKAGGSGSAQLRAIELARKEVTEEVVLKRDFAVLPSNCSQCKEGIFLGGNDPAAGPLPSVENGWLKFTVRSNTGSGAGGYYVAKFPHAEAMPGESLSVRWQQRFDRAFLDSSKHGGGFKLAIIGDADQNSCSTNEVVVQNTGSRQAPQMYHGCGLFEPFDGGLVPDGRTSVDIQPGGPNACGHNWLDNSGEGRRCYRLVPDETFTFDVQIDLAQIAADKSRIRLWVDSPSQGRELVIDYSRVLVDSGKGYGAVWLLPYNTNKDATKAHPDGHTWYDNLVVGKAGTPGPVPSRPDPDPPIADLPTATTGKNLAACKAALTARGGGWCEMKVSDAHPSISSVWPTIYPPGIFSTGPAGVLDNWTGAAFDPVDLKLYFTGGGHGGYGGNEIYEFDIGSGEWSRLTDPMPLTHTRWFGNPPSLERTVDFRKVPHATHTYDGIIFNRDTRTFYVWTGIPPDRPVPNPTEADTTPVEQGGRLIEGNPSGLYEFNPSRTESRNGIAPLAWRVANPDIEGWYPMSTRLPDGRFLMGSYDRLHYFDRQADGALKQGELFARWAGWGDGSATYDPVRQWVWVLVADNIFAFDRDGRKAHEYRAGLNDPLSMPPHGKALEFGADGRLYSWDGAGKVYSYDPDDKTWFVEDWGGKGPYAHAGGGRTYSKFRHLGDDFFVGLDTHKTGVWIYKPVGRFRPVGGFDPS